jgi:hypothetical protein
LLRSGRGRRRRPRRHAALGQLTPPLGDLPLDGFKDGIRKVGPESIELTGCRCEID